MPVTTITKPTFPSWYNTERDTQKTINRLTNIKELSFYLSNPDEYIRRLAIIRIQELYLKDAVEPLRMLLDDSLETAQNKELAAWTIKSISHEWNIDIFYNNKYLARFNGTEKYNDIYKLCIKESLPSIKFDFTSSLIKSEIDLDKTDLRKSEDVEFDMPFSLKEWFSSWCEEFLIALKKLFINLPQILLKLLIIVFKFIVITIPKQSFKMIRKAYSFIKSKQNKRPKYQSYYSSMKPSFSIKNVLFKFFYILFSPVRYLIRKRKLIAVLIIAAYCMLTYTTTGRLFTLKKFNVDLKKSQNEVVDMVKAIGIVAYSELKNIVN